MSDRRDFLKKSAITALSLSTTTFPACLCDESISSSVPMKTNHIRRALVAWYSRTGNTGRAGRLIAKTLIKSGIDVSASDLREAGIRNGDDYGLIIVGSPVFYYDAPGFVKTWIDSLPDIAGTPVAAYVTFGGPEGNQHNAACTIIQGLAAKGGVPVAIDAFMNMGTYPVNWSGGKN